MNIKFERVKKTIEKSGEDFTEGFAADFTLVRFGRIRKTYCMIRRGGWASGNQIIIESSGIKNFIYLSFHEIKIYHSDFV